MGWRIGNARYEFDLKRRMRCFPEREPLRLPRARSGWAMRCYGSDPRDRELKSELRIPGGAEQINLQSSDRSESARLSAGAGWQRRGSCRCEKDDLRERNRSNRPLT